MNGRRRRAFLVGTLGTIVVFAVLFTLVGARRVVRSLLTAEPSLVAATFGLALCWLIAWSLMLRTVMRSLEIGLSVQTSFLVYAGAVFANNVTPFGQAGGEPIAAALISKASDAEYETSLVGIASVDICNVVPSVSLVLVGVGAYAATATVGERIQDAVGLAIVLVGGTGLVIGFAWRYRATIVERAPAIVASVGGFLGGGRLDGESLEAELEKRLHRMFEDVDRVRTDRRRLAVVIGLSLVGWLFQAIALLAAFAALGHGVSIAVALFVVPLGYVAGSTPLPGGLGGIEAALVAMLVPATGIAAPAVTAAVLIFRGAVFWMPILVGGGSIAALGARAVT
ncbi:lysylphosphatidylglycerol synthase transmembrane domain-containing protein [Halosolutus gelatinilyticus]|uniref:lysylphosphatidylglycerol synthase transmembrane domain-containing protein n=1 Tax=Halosolutus gelatinilyticus TaxID=2931975 RepID=UPI001FF20CB3|nr:lysylphosphatidylglycerol synthase transmembrane domain-containing protein [Halosolutus gelatinilyticus]